VSDAQANTAKMCSPAIEFHSASRVVPATPSRRDQVFVRSAHSGCDFTRRQLLVVP